MAEKNSPGPMHSQAQWRFLFATKKPFAHKWAHETQAERGGPKVAYHTLPKRESIRKR